MPPAPPPKASSAAATLIVQRCVATTSLRRARQLHAFLLISAPLPDVSPSFLQNNILSMYARCGSLEDAQLMFDKMPQRKVVSYNALISAYSRSPRHFHLAFRLFDQLRNESFSYDEFTISGILQASAGIGDLAVGSSLHAWCVKIGVLDNLPIQTSLLGMYAKCGNVSGAAKVFYRMKDKDIIAWNAIISAIAKNGKFLEGFKVYGSMLRNGIQPDLVTYSLLLNVCAKFEDYSHGKLVHAQAVLSGINIDLPLQNALLDMYCSCGDMDTAFEVFRRIENPNLVSWNTMLRGFWEKGDGQKVMDMFIQLRQETSLKPDEYTLVAVISSAVGFPARAYGEPLHAQTEKKGLLKSVYIGSALMSVYFSCGDPVSSLKIFDSFMDKDVVLWTDMIAGHVKIGESEEALKFFLEMSREGCDLDSFALSSGLSACADLVTLRQGEMIHCLAIKLGNEAEVCVSSNLIDMYAKNGELRAAVYTFSRLPGADLRCWNAMLTGLGNHGKALEAFQIFFKMLKFRLQPDQVTFLSLLSACSHCGLVDQCRYFWNLMKENNIQPGPKHYSCMIRILSQAGQWEEAEKTIMESPFVDDYLKSYRTILSSCIRNGNLRVGIHAAEQILNINADDTAANVLLTKLYAASGRWGDVVETRRRMRHSMMDKDPGLSWIEILNNVHVFSSGEVNDELKKVLGNLLPPEIEEIEL